MNILTLPEKSVIKQIAAVELGFPSNALEVVAKRIGLPKQRIISGLRLRPRTVTSREKNRSRFTLNESERFLRVIRVHRLAGEIFTSKPAVAEWLNSPDRALGTKTPLQMLATDIGAAKVTNLLRAMAHGVPI